MITNEFGILEPPSPNDIFEDYEPEKYNCIYIDDDYIDDWYAYIADIDTFYGSLAYPGKGLDRHGITLIPPESLTPFITVLQDDTRISTDKSIADLLNLLCTAKDSCKYIIHFGV